MVVWGGVPPHNHKTARAREMHADDDTSETYYTHTHHTAHTVRGSVVSVVSGSNDSTPGSLEMTLNSN